jgi:hypothetical protein
MSLFKAIWIERDPAFEDVRRKVRAAGPKLEDYPWAVPLRRRNRYAPRPYWDPFWPRRLHVAADDLGLDSIVVNSRMMFKTVVERNAAMARAEELWAQEIAHRVNGNKSKGHDGER